MTLKGDGASFTTMLERMEPSRKVMPSDKPQHVAVLCTCIGSIPDVRPAQCVLCVVVHPSKVGLVCREQFPTRTLLQSSSMKCF